MRQTSILLFSLLSLSLFANGVRPNECSRVGQQLSRVSTDVNAVADSKRVTRTGTRTGSAQLSQNVSLTAQLVETFTIRECVSANYTRTERQCSQVSSPLSVQGMGSEDYRRLFNSRESNLRKAAVIQRAFSLSDDAALYLARFLTTYASENKIPTSFEGFDALL